jgi:hypothetical protein
MGDWLIWLLLGSFIVILFCIYSLSSQVERCVHLAVEVITTNQRRIIEQLEVLSNTRKSAPEQTGEFGLERRMVQRRSDSEAARTSAVFERRYLPGRRRSDILARSN